MTPTTLLSWEIVLSISRGRTDKWTVKEGKNMDIVSLLDLISLNNWSTMEFGGMQFNGLVLYCFQCCWTSCHGHTNLAPSWKGNKVTELAFIVKLVLFTVIWSLILMLFLWLSAVHYTLYEIYLLYWYGSNVSKCKYHGAICRFLY